VQVTAQLSADDYRDFLSLVVRLDRLRRRVRLGGIFLCAMLFFVAFAVLSFVWRLASGFHDGAFVDLLDRPELLIPIVIGLLLIPVALIWLRSIVRLFGRLFADGEPVAMDETVLRDGVNIGESWFDFDGDGIQERLALVQSSYAWDAFQDLRETDRNLYLVIDAGSALIVPKRGFDDDASLQAFKTFAASHIGAVR